MNIHFKINRAAQFICEELQNNGFEAVIAGGAVRDLLLGEEPHDWDVATNARPEQVESIFVKTIPVGKSFGVINVLIDDEQFQVATFREDSKESDGRRPDSVSFSSKEEDAARRDFTVNGLFYDPISNELFDFVGGVQDLRNKVIRFIGNPEERIEEDSLRILRFFRFGFRLDFALDEASHAAAVSKKALLNRVSKERIRDEVSKILIHKNASKAFRAFRESGIWQELVPEIHALYDCAQDPIWHAEGSVGNHTELMLRLAGDKLENNLVLAWSIVLHDIAKPHTFAINEHGRITAHGHAGVGAEVSREILNSLRFDRATIDAVCWIVDNHMKLHEARGMKLSTRKKLYAHPCFPILLELNRLDCLGSHFNLVEHEWVKKDFESIPPEVARPVPYVMGRDLIALGYKPDGKFKVVLEAAMEKQMENAFENREEALQFAAILAEETLSK